MINTFLALDVETTGLNYAEDRIIEYGIAFFDKGHLVHSEGDYLQSDIPNRGEHVNNITPDKIAGGKPQQEIMRHLWLAIQRQIEYHMPVCAYNACFDLSFMAYSFMRCGLDPEILKECRVLDPLVIHRHYDKVDWKYKSGARKLQRMSERYSTGHIPDHTAMTDAIVAGELQIELNYHFPFGSYTSLGLHRLQERWAAEWMDGLEKLVAPKPVKKTKWPVEIPCPSQFPQVSKKPYQSSLFS